MHPSGSKGISRKPRHEGRKLTVPSQEQSVDPKSILASLGVNLSDSDLQELASYVRLSRDRPKEALRSLPELSALFSRSIPDTSLARARLSRSLEGLEYLVRAARTVLASDDPDLIRGLQRVLRETSSDFFPEGVDRSKIDLDAVVRSLMVRTGTLVAKIPESRDPRVQEAVILLFRAGQALNPLGALPKVPAADTVEIKLDSVTATKRRGRHKGPE